MMTKKERKALQTSFMLGGPYHPDYAVNQIKLLWKPKAVDKVIKLAGLWKYYAKTH